MTLTIITYFFYQISLFKLIMVISNSAKRNFSIEMCNLENNLELVRDHLFRQMTDSLNIGNQLIHEEMNGFSILLRPLVTGFYSTIIKKNLENGTKKSINDMLKISKEIILNGIDIKSMDFYSTLDETFPSYLINDQTGRQCKKSHKNYKRLVENLKKTYEAQILGIIPLLKINILVKTYDELCRKAFSTAIECKNIVKLQTDQMKIAQDIIQEDLSILNIPTNGARSLIFKVLKKGFNKQVQVFNEAIDQIYENR